LVVGAGPAELRLVHAELQPEHFRVLSTNVTDLLHRVATRRIHLLLIFSEKIKGAFEICREIRADSRHARLPILVAAADCSPALELEASQIGIDGRLALPLQPPELVARVRNLLRLADADRDERLFQQLSHNDRLVTLGQLAASVAHEINNPLAFILSNVNSLKSYWDDARRIFYAYHDSWEAGMAAERELKFAQSLIDAASLMQETAEGGRQVRELVQELKTLTGPDGGLLESVDLAEIAASTLVLTERELSCRARVVKALAPARIMRANRGKLHQVVLNLLVNAGQALDGNEPEQNEIRVVTDIEGGDAVLSVTDTGCGIPLEHQERIFDLFYTTKPSGVGTGIGLSVCAMVVKRLGGKIVVRSAAGEGSTFTVRVPVEVAATV
jgi:signal transduction histidine kinase